MLDSFKVASWKARILNLSVAVLLFSSLIGCFIAYVGVLQEGTVNNTTQDIWQFYYNGIQDELIWLSYSDLDTDLGRSCKAGGIGLVVLEVLTLLFLAPTFACLTVRILGLHISLLPPARSLQYEFYGSVASCAGQILSCVIWGATCYHSSTQLAVFGNGGNMTPTGYIWLILCILYLFVSMVIYFFLRQDPTCVLGTMYGGQLRDGSDGTDPIATSGHLDEQADTLPPEQYGGQI